LRTIEGNEFGSCHKLSEEKFEAVSSCFQLSGGGGVLAIYFWDWFVARGLRVLRYHYNLFKTWNRYTIDLNGGNRCYILSLSWYKNKRPHMPCLIATTGVAIDLEKSWPQKIQKMSLHFYFIGTF
jgi:hypothetical protein